MFNSLNVNTHYRNETDWKTTPKTLIAIKFCQKIKKKYFVTACSCNKWHHVLLGRERVRIFIRQLMIDEGKCC